MVRIFFTVILKASFKGMVDLFLEHSAIIKDQLNIFIFSPILKAGHKGMVYLLL